MKYIQYLLLFPILSIFIACNSTKEPVKEPIKEVVKDNNESNKTVVTKERVILTQVSPPEILNTKQTALKETLDIYLQELSTFNTDAIVYMTYPRLFNVIDLDLFRQYIDSMMNSTDIEMQSYESNITKLSPVTTFSNNTKFAQAEYISTITIHFLNNELYNTEEKINFLYDALIHKYGRENILVHVKNRTLRIKKLEKLLIIKEENSEWKFLGDNSKYRQLYPRFLPPEILKIIN